jgi:hypothetical protein
MIFTRKKDSFAKKVELYEQKGNQSQQNILAWLNGIYDSDTSYRCDFPLCGFQDE